MTLCRSDVEAVACGVLTFVVVRAIMKTKSSPKFKTPPGPLRLPVIGTLYAHGINPESLRNLGRKYGDIFTIYIGARRVVVIQSLKILQNASKMVELCDRGMGEDYVAKIVNPNTNGILICNYESAKATRSISLSIMRELGIGRSGMEAKVQEIVEQLMTSFSATNQEPFDPTTLLEYSVTKVILFTMVNQNPRNDDDEFRSFMEAIKDFASSSLVLKQLPFLRHFPPFKRTYNRVVGGSSFMNKQIDKWVGEHIENHQTGMNDDFTEQYLTKVGNGQDNLSEKMDRQQLVYLLRDFLLAGSDTTISTLRWIILSLANRQGIQDKLREEIFSALGKEKEIHYADRKHVPFVEAFISETQRVFTLAPLALPHGASKDVELFGFDIPNNSLLLFNIYAIHRDERLWDNPDEFNPGRFIDENGKYKDLTQFVPFMLGRRSCLGEDLARQELFLFTVNLVRCFRILPPGGVGILSDEGVPGFIFRPKPFQVCVIPV